MYRSIEPILALVIGILILIVPGFLNYLVAIYLIVIAMRKLKRWGEEPADADSDIALLLECYQYTRDKGNGVPYLLYRRVAS